MRNLEKQLSNLKPTADQTIFRSLQVTPELKNKVTSRIKNEVKNESRFSFRRWIPVTALALAAAFTVTTLWPSSINHAEAFTIKPESMNSLYTLGSDLQQGPDSTPLEIEIDSYNASYYTWDHTGRYLVFGNKGDLFLYDAKESSTINITNTPDRWELMPTWSPGGKTIAFTSRPLVGNEGFQIDEDIDPWIMQADFAGKPTVVEKDGTNYRVISDEIVREPISWSADGKKLAYGVDGQIYQYHLDQREEKRMIQSEFGLDVEYIGSPSWSPVKDELVIYYAKQANYETEQTQGYALLNMKEKSTKILFEYAAPFNPVKQLAKWKHNGDMIALHFAPGRHNDPLGLMVYDVKTEQIKNLGVAFQATWEPKGERIAFVDNDDRRNIHLFTPINEIWDEYIFTYEQFVEGFSWRP